MMHGQKNIKSEALLFLKKDPALWNLY